MPDVLIDPDQVDYQDNLDKASKMRKLAQALRKQSLEGQTAPAGQMIGKHFVAAPTQAMLLPAIQELRASMAERGSDAATRNARLQQQQLGQQFIANAPQATPGQQLQGPPVDEDTPMPTAPPTPPTRQVILKHALQGMLNPATAGVAKVYGDSTLKEMDASEARQDKFSEAAKVREAASAEKAADRQARMDVLIEQIAQKDAAGKESNALKLQLGQLAHEAAMDRNQAMRDAAATRAAAAVAGKTAPGDKPLPNQILKTLSASEDAAANIDAAASSFKKDYSGLLQGAKNFNATYNPFDKGGDEAAQWWKKYGRQIDVKEAHDLFGASFTAAEQKRWADATISPGMRGDVIAKNLKIRADIAKRMHQNNVDRAVKSGYNKAGEAFDTTTIRPTESPSTDIPKELQQYFK